jgi:hypothetical protein
VKKHVVLPQSNRNLLFLGRAGSTPAPAAAQEDEAAVIVAHESRLTRQEGSEVS